MLTATKPTTTARVVSATVLALLLRSGASAAPLAYISGASGFNNVRIIDTATNTEVGGFNCGGGGPRTVAVNTNGTVVYTANFVSNTVSVVNAASNTVTALVPVGSNPFGIATTPGGGPVYVANVSSNTVSVIDTTTNTVTATIPVGTNPQGVAVNHTGTRAYVANYGSNSVSVIDTSTNAVLATVPVGTHPGQLAVRPDGAHVYVSNLDSDNVSVIDTSTNTVTATVPVGSGPYGIAVHPAGTFVYVGNNNLAGLSVSVINTATNAVTATIPIGTSPKGIAVLPSGAKVYVSVPGAGQVKVIDTATNTVSATISGGGGESFGQFIGLAACGDSTVSISEQCDLGAGNGNPANCCTSSCTFRSPTETCRTAADVCDVAEMCTGSSDTCPSDVFASSSTACASDGNACTDDHCDGNGTCLHENNAGPCNDGAFCNGPDTCSSGACAIHAGDPCAGPDGDGNCSESCNEVADDCTAADPDSSACTDGLFCTGSDSCSGGTCSSHTGDPCAGGPECADTCNEATDDCFDPSGTSCGADASVCTLDQCDGAGTCTHPAGNAGTECRASAGECDVAEACDGTSPACPSDGFAPATTPCTTDGNVCTDDQCDGAGVCTHPAGNAGAVCRSDAGQCDVAELCDGSTPACPADGFAPDGTPCDDGAPCTIDDQCTAGACGGSSMTCGDGTVQAGCNEDCDDGGLVDDDGCDDTCHFEPCKPAPDATCKEPFVSGRASIRLRNADDDTKDSTQWKWNNGSQTDKVEFGDPVTADDYWLCIYGGGALLSTTRVPAGGTCGASPCWSEKATGFQFKSKAPSVDGATRVSLRAGDAGKARVQFKGKGNTLDVPDLNAIGSPLIVQLVNASGGTCWSATFSAPFAKNDGVDLIDKAD